MNFLRPIRNGNIYGKNKMCYDIGGIKKEREKVMKRKIITTFCVSAILATLLTGCAPEAGEMVKQDLDYTEATGDVPNPDRGFYKANDGMVVPVSGEGWGTIQTGKSPSYVGGTKVETRISHIYFDLRNFSDNAFTGEGQMYDENYFAPEDVSIRTRGDAEPHDYNTHFNYWYENVAPTLGHGTSQPLTDSALDYIRDKLEQVREGNGVAIVRFNYDGEGLAWVYADHPDDGYRDSLIQDVEPDKETMLTQIGQLKDVLHEYEDVIMCVDGGFFGPWGEMHSTTYGTDPEAYVWLLDALLDAVPESRSITVHAGAFLSWYNAKHGTEYTFETIDQIPAPKEGSPESRFGFFNDSYAFGTEVLGETPDDWGSLSEGSYWSGAKLGKFDRGKLMTWIRNQNNFYGGEAQGGRTMWNSYPFLAWEGSYAQTVYLNADYDADVHNRWAEFTYNEENMSKIMLNMYSDPYHITKTAIYDPACEGKNGVEYLRDRLGYRLVLRESLLNESVSKKGTLSFAGKIQNVGFGNLVNKKAVYAILESQETGETYSVLTDIDTKQWKPDLDSRETNIAAYRDVSFKIALKKFGKDLEPGTYNVYLKINDPLEKSENKRCVRFANNGEKMWNAHLGANLIGTTEIK